ncbi:N-acetylgalactosamine-6-sulfatase [Bacteroidia bacterium]|nr:N-acetylgalactosamine-6-sulfatase [Bacteroidia bacterium]
MNKRTVLTGALTVGALAAHAKAPAVQPNILIIYTDDMGVGDVSFLNSGWVATPNIDRLAREGLVVRNYYSAAPVSSPSRAGLTTGMCPLQVGITCYLQTRAGNARIGQADWLDPSFPSMARAMKEAGYATGHFGKWHMGGGRDVKNAPSITSYGFDEYVSTWESPDPDPLITGDPKWIWSPRDSIKRWDRTAYFVEKTLDFMARNTDRPCFVNLWPDDMHTPWVPSGPFVDNEKSWTTEPNFRQTLAEYDRQIGLLIEGLERLGIAERTVVIFSSDNGPNPSFERQRTNGLRGMKCSLYEGGIRMPLVVRWKGHVKAGAVDRTTVLGAVDLLPSLCAIAGARLPEGFDYGGEDMSRALLGTPCKRSTDLKWDFGHNRFYNFPPTDRSPGLAIRRGEWKLIMNEDGSGAELYNLRLDEKESRDVASRNPRIVAELRSELLAFWGKRLVPPAQARK